eukprot:m.62008 g.62008  ORF g.62008 m.62008 type:complete len:205 (-) comp11475_c0_seq1:1098-1712(-)
MRLNGAARLLATTFNMAKKSERLVIRKTTENDFDEVTELLRQSYSKLLSHDYDSATLQHTLPDITRARPELLSSGTYYVVELFEKVDGDKSKEEKVMVGCGGFTAYSPMDSNKSQSQPNKSTIGHIRHVATHPRYTRRGIGRMIMETVFDDARQQGIKDFECFSTLTAVPFYKSFKFQPEEKITIPISGCEFPAVKMKTRHNTQ